MFFDFTNRHLLSFFLKEDRLMIRHLITYTLLLTTLFAETNPSFSTPPQFEVAEFLKITPQQRSEISNTGGRAIIQGILTSVGMSYCTLQDPHSFQSITCGFDPAHRGEYYAQRPGTRVQLSGIPVVGSNGLLTLSDARVYDPHRPPPNPEPVFQNAVFETTNIPASSAPIQYVNPPTSENTETAPAESSSSPNTSTQNSVAGETPEGSPQFIRRAVPRREGIGRSASIYIGGTFFQSGDGSGTVSPSLSTGFSGSNSLDTRSKTGMTIGAKFSYSMPIKNLEGETRSFIPGVEGEMLYSNFNHQANLSGSGASGQYRTDIDILALMGNGTLKFNLTPFYPYIGLGAGFAYVNAQNAQLRSSTTGVNASLEDSDDVSLAGQAFVGTEYILSKDWSLFGEYKYLHLQDLNLNHSNATFDYDFLGLHYFNVGVRNYF